LKFDDTFFSREHRYSLGLEEISGKHYASIPVSNGVVDYEEYYELSDDRYDAFLRDESAAIGFIEECRRREHDDLLLEQPGSKRGTPV